MADNSGVAKDDMCDPWRHLWDEQLETLETMVRSGKDRLVHAHIHIGLGEPEGVGGH